jgi:hypothetical protein
VVAGFLMAHGPLVVSGFLNAHGPLVVAGFLSAHGPLPTRGFLCAGGPLYLIGFLSSRGPLYLIGFLRLNGPLVLIGFLQWSGFRLFMFMDRKGLSKRVGAHTHEKVQRCTFSCRWGATHIVFIAVFCAVFLVAQDHAVRFLHQDVRHQQASSPRRTVHLATRLRQT